MTQSWLEKFSNMIAGETLTGAAKGIGEGVGYVAAGGSLDDVDDLIMKVIGQHKQESLPASKEEEQMMPVLKGLAAMSNPLSAAGQAIDFAAAVPDMVQQKIANAEPEIGTIAETGLKRRLVKGGAQAKQAIADSTQRARPRLSVPEKNFFIENESVIPLEPLGSQKFQVIQDNGSDVKTYLRDLGAAGKTQRMRENVKSVLENVIENPPYKDPEKNLDLTNRLRNSLEKLGELETERIQMSEGSTSQEGTTHPLGIQLDYTPSLKQEYLGKGFGSQMYQNLADQYGGAISDPRSTSVEARAVYERLNALETNLKNVDRETRMVIPPSYVKNNPKSLMKFEKEVEKYVKKYEKEYAKEIDNNKYDDLTEAMGTEPALPNPRRKIEIKQFEEQFAPTGSRAKLSNSMAKNYERRLADAAKDRTYLTLNEIKTLFPKLELPENNPVTNYPEIRYGDNLKDGRFQIEGQNDNYRIYDHGETVKKENKIKIPEYEISQFGISPRNKRDLNGYAENGFISSDEMRRIFGRTMPSEFSDGLRVYQFKDQGYSIEVKK